MAGDAAGSPTDDVERAMRTAAASLGLTRTTAAVSFGIWATNDAVWVRAPEQFLTRIDPTTNEVVEVIDGPVGAGDVTVAFGSVWATSGHALTVYRFEP